MWWVSVDVVGVRFSGWQGGSQTSVQRVHELELKLGQLEKELQRVRGGGCGPLPLPSLFPPSLLTRIRLPPPSDSLSDNRPAVACN